MSAMIAHMIQALRATPRRCSCGTCLACPRDGANAREGEARDVLRQLGHLLTTEGEAREKTREDRVTVPIEKALALNAEDARPQVVIGSSRAKEFAHDGIHASVGGADLLLHDDVQGGRGLGHLARHQLAEPSGMALIEEAEEK